MEEQNGEKEIDVEVRRAQNRLRWAESEEKKMEGDENQDMAATSMNPEGATPTPRTPLVPKAPSPEQIMNHELTHTPYADWCPTCVAAMGKDLPHRRVPEDPATVPVVELDYGFLTTADKNDELIPILVGAQRHSGYGYAAVTPVKGRSDVPAIVGFVRFLMEAGLTAKLRIRSDSEPAAQAVAQAVASRRAPAVTIIETTPVGSSSSLGTAERMIQELSGRVRALCLSVQGKWNVQIRATMPIFRWIVRHAMWVHNRFQPVNGCTPFAAVQGCQYHNKIMALGDAVVVRIQDLKKTAKLEPRWSMGIWLGKAVDSDEHIVATLMGIKLGRATYPPGGQRDDPE